VRGRDQCQGEGEQQDHTENPTTTASQTRQLAQLQLARGGSASGPLARLTSAISAHRADLGGRQVELGQDGA